ncbi:nuclear transport factor 2 family protein [Roseateles sp. DAIF2]|nr:nuclear transport factor 2 family protein [Roseateles sp. DAIF2]
MLSTLVSLGGLLLSTHVLAGNTEIDAAQVPLQHYVLAHATGNPELIHQAFAEGARVTGHINGELISWSVAEYAARFTGKPAADESQRSRSFEILDLAGDAAVAKVVLDYPTVRFVDHMALLKVAGQWRIVGKSFHAQAKARPQP